MQKPARAAYRFTERLLVHLVNQLPKLAFDAFQDGLIHSRGVFGWCVVMNHLAGAYRLLVHPGARDDVGPFADRNRRIRPADPDCDEAVVYVLQQRYIAHWST
jgi:hypothetical protein